LIDKFEGSMSSMKQDCKSVFGAALVLSIFGVGWHGLFHNRSQAQRVEPQGYALSATEGEHFIRGGGNVLIKVDPTRGSDKLALGTQQVPAGGRIPIHRHAQMDEVFYVVEGSGTFILNEARLIVEKGATVFIPKGAWHGFEKGDKEMLLLWAVAPPGLEGMFREVGSRPGEPPKQFSLEQLNNIARSYGGTEYK
jgi:quercetin dioxygenase-like cupin family protein